MANIKRIAMLLFSLFFLSAFARSAVEAAQAANEVDTVQCTKSGANMIDYCLGYCEKETGMSCSSADYTELADTSDIDRCTCTCGPQDDFVAYSNVPCGLDLMQKGSPSGTDGASTGSICCLPAAMLFGFAGFAMMRK